VSPAAHVIIHVISLSTTAVPTTNTAHRGIEFHSRDQNQLKNTRPIGSRPPQPLNSPDPLTLSRLLSVIDTIRQDAARFTSSLNEINNNLCSAHDLGRSGCPQCEKTKAEILRAYRKFYLGGGEGPDGVLPENLRVGGRRWDRYLIEYRREIQALITEVERGEFRG